LKTVADAFASPPPHAEPPFQKKQSLEKQKTQPQSLTLGEGKIFYTLKVRYRHSLHIAQTKIDEWKMLYKLIDVEFWLKYIERWCNNRAESNRWILSEANRAIENWLKIEHQKAYEKKEMIQEITKAVMVGNRNGNIHSEEDTRPEVAKDVFEFDENGKSILVRIVYNKNTGEVISRRVHKIGGPI
jgi:hypothetical protein